MGNSSTRLPRARATKKTTSFLFCVVERPTPPTRARTEEEEEERPTRRPRARSGTREKWRKIFKIIIFLDDEKHLSCSTTSTSLSNYYLSIIYLSISKPETAPTRFVSPRTNRSLGRTVVPRVRAKIEARVRSRRLRFVPRRVRALLESR